MSTWESGITKQARAHEEAAALRAKTYALEAQLAKATAQVEWLERQKARLEGELRVASATVDRMAAALAERGAR